MVAGDSVLFGRPGDLSINTSYLFSCHWPIVHSVAFTFRLLVPATSGSDER